MNRNLKTCWTAISAGAIALSVAACTSLLDENPLGSLSDTNFYKNATDALTALNGAYQSLHDGGSNGYVVGRNYIFMIETPTPQVVAYSGATNVRGCFDTYTCSATLDQYVETSWSSIYAAINRANAVIDNVPNIEEMDPALRERVVGEAKFLRAFHYFNMVRLWGGVPLFVHETKSLNDLAKPRNSADEVYAQIITDLSDAAKVLPPSYSGSDFGRATKGAAQTLLGKVYLQRGVVGRTNPFGDPLYWPTAQPSDISDAVAQLREVVSGGQYSLVPDYGMLWNEATEQNSEVIWSVQNMNMDGQGLHVSNYFNPRNSGFAGSSWTAAGAELPFFQSYAPNDKRRDVTWLTEYTDINGQEYQWGATGPQEWPHAGPQLKKYLIERTDVTDNPRDLVLLRYGDVLLMLAEALTEEAGAPTAEAYQLVDQVRARAGLGPLAEGMSYAQFHEALYHERSWELATEQHLWYDAPRFWSLFTQEVIANAQLGKTDPTAYPRRSVPERVPVIEEPKSRLMPIPQEAIDRNHELTQNPGY